MVVIREPKVFWQKFWQILGALLSKDKYGNSWTQKVVKWMNHINLFLS